MADGDDFKPVVNPPKDHSMVATSEAKVALPFAVEWCHVANSGLPEPCNGLENA